MPAANITQSGRQLPPPIETRPPTSYLSSTDNPESCNQRQLSISMSEPGNGPSFPCSFISCSIPSPTSSLSSSYSPSSTRLSEVKLEQLMRKRQIHSTREKRRVKRIADLSTKLQEKLEKVGYKTKRPTRQFTLSSVLDYLTRLEDEVFVLKKGQKRSLSSVSPSLSSSEAVAEPIPKQVKLEPSTATRPPSSHSDPSKGSGEGSIADELLGEEGLPQEAEGEIFLGSCPSTNPKLAPQSSLEVEEAGKLHASLLLPPGASTANFRDVFHSSSVPTVLAAFDGRVLEANGAFSQIIGRTILGANGGGSEYIWETLLPADSIKLMDHIRQFSAYTATDSAGVMVNNGERAEPLSGGSSSAWCMGVTLCTPASTITCNILLSMVRNKLGELCCLSLSFFVVSAFPTTMASAAGSIIALAFLEEEDDASDTFLPSSSSPCSSGCSSSGEQ